MNDLRSGRNQSQTLFPGILPFAICKTSCYQATVPATHGHSSDSCFATGVSQDSLCSPMTCIFPVTTGPLDWSLGEGKSLVMERHHLGAYWCQLLCRPQSKNFLTLCSPLHSPSTTWRSWEDKTSLEGSLKQESKQRMWRWMKPDL